jgi:hypothetical protein
MQNFLTNKEISHEIDNFCETYENKNYYGPDVIEVGRHMAKWAEDKVSEYYEDRLDAAACEYTAKGYATGKKHLTEDLKEELNKRLDLLIDGEGHPEVMKRVEGVIKAYKSILEWLDNESNGISKKDN